MATRKRNEWLDAGSEDEIDDANDSDAQEDSRGALAGRSIKRRRVDQASDEEASDFDSDDEETTTQQPDRTTAVETTDDASDKEGPPTTAQLSDPGAPHHHPSKSKAPIVKPLSAKQLLASQRAAKKTGVIYISRIPPFMKPATLSHFLSPHAPAGLGRIFLTPEDSASHKQRVRSGGNKKRSFTDGWVEFHSKRDAKVVAATLNGNIVGGKKGNFYHDDVWNIKYLTGFKWSHLTEQIANENAERAARLRAEISRTRKENRDFVADVERGKMVQGIKDKRAAKAGRDGDAGAGAGAGVEGQMREIKRSFKQNEAMVKKGRDAKGSEQPEATKRVLSKLF